MPDSSLIEALARALLAGEPTPDLLFDRCRRTLGRRWRWLRPLTERYLAKFGTEAWPRHREVVQFLRQDAGLRRACRKHFDELVVAEWLLPAQRMFAGGRVWNIPAIESVGDLAKWLGLNPGELRWFADLKALGYKKREPRLEHYHYRVLAKRFGSVRLIEAPKARLKDLQRQILLSILGEVPPHPGGAWLRQRPQFTYSGFVFALVEPWPVAWAYDDDDYYIDYVDDEYWLYSLRYPGVRLELIIVD
jgi:RNA-directed DNA polymerase